MAASNERANGAPADAGADRDVSRGSTGPGTEAIRPGGGAYLPVFSSVQMRVYWRSTSGGMMAKVKSLASTSGVG